MAALLSFYRNHDDWRAAAQRLKLTPCPHCHTVGALIRHGHLYGYDERHASHKSVRAHRIFCSNRNARHGCGHTFSVWRADAIRRLSLTAAALWRFLRCAALVSIAEAILTCLDCRRSDRTWHRLWKRFALGQSAIRTALHSCCLPPTLPVPADRGPTAHVVHHLQDAFPNEGCPITAFQLATQTFFF